MKKEFIAVILWSDIENGERVYICAVYHDKRRTEQKIGHLYMNGMSFNYRILKEEPKTDELNSLRAELIKGLKK